MKNVTYFINILLEFLLVLGRRLVGKKHHSNWSLKTELIWASTRLTILSSNKLGLDWYKQLGEKFKPKPTQADLVEIQKIEKGSTRFLIIRPSESSNAIKSGIIYFHGGGFVAGSPETSIEFLTRLAIKTEKIVYAPFYPLAPENVYPAANIFAMNFTEMILEKYAKEECYLAGDSAGASLVLSTMKNLKNSALIKGCILISPWVKPLADSGSIEINSDNDVGNREFLIACYKAYLQNNEILSEYPLTFTKENLPSLPRTMVTVGELEMLLDQTLELANHLKDKSTLVELKQYQSMFHTFWNLAPNIKQAENLISDVGEWLNKQN